MAKTEKKMGRPANEEVKNKTTLYIAPLSHNKLKFIDIKEGTNNVNTLIQTAIDEFIERWEKKNGPINL